MGSSVLPDASFANLSVRICCRKCSWLGVRCVLRSEGLLSEFKVFYVNLHKCIFWLIVEAILQDARCNDKIHRNLHVSDSSSVHHQEYFTVHTATVYVILVC